MPSNDQYVVRWTVRSLKNAQDIRNYLTGKFTAGEADNFSELLYQFEQTVSLFPKIYPKSIRYPTLRKAVLHKNTSVFYKIVKNTVTVVAMQDSRQSEPK